MKVSESIISDLLHLYFDNEASEDTRVLVEEYFKANPDYADKMKAAYGNGSMAEIVDTQVPSQELLVLAKTQKLLRLRTWLLVLAIFGTTFPFLYFTFFDLAGTDLSGYRWLYANPGILLGYLGLGAWVGYGVLWRRLRIISV